MLRLPDIVWSRWFRRLLISFSLIFSIAVPTISAEKNSAETGLVNLSMPVRESGTAPVAAIYVTDHGLRPDPKGPQVIMALWANGLAIWSADREKGGPPYFAAQVPWIMSRSLVNQLGKKGIFDDSVRDDRYFGPDSTYTTIAICDGPRRVNMSSWHEHFERNGKSVTLASGVTALDGRDLEQVIAGEPAEYRRFREVWKTVQNALLEILPENGTPMEECEFTLEPQLATASAEEEPQKADQIGQLFGQPVYRGDLPDFGPIKDKVGRVFMQPLVQHYCRQHHDATYATDEEVSNYIALNEENHRHKLEAKGEQLRSELADLEKKLAAADLSDSDRKNLDLKKRSIELQLNPPKLHPGVTRYFLSQWKFQQDLYQNYGGGRILFQQFGLEAFDAMHRWLRESEKAGDFKITDKELHAAFYAYFTTVKHGAFLQDPKKKENAKLLDEFLHPAWQGESKSKSP